VQTPFINGNNHSGNEKEVVKKSILLIFIKLKWMAASLLTKYLRVQVRECSLRTHISQLKCLPEAQH